LISTSGEGIWRKFLSDLRMTCPSFCTIGWTGTPFRGNGVWLTAGKDPLFTKVVARVGMRQLLDDGYLSPLTPMITQSRIDVSDVRMSGDDYAINALAKATDTDALVQSTAAEICALFADRKRWLVFAVTVEHAEHMRDAIRTHGIKAQMVSANTPAAERDRIITDYRAGRERCLVNVAVLTTGFDVPEVDAIALLRATKSPVLITQIAGRGMRLAPGKTDCAWADFSNSTEMLGPIDEIKGRLPTTKATGDAPFRICPGCGSRCAAGASECAECGHVFPPPERIKHGDTARGAAVLSEHVAREVERAVTRVTYARHNKTFSMISSEDPPPTLRVEYWDGVEVVAKEWVSLEHGGYPRLKAERWWRDRTPSGSPAPRTVDEAIVRANQGEVRSPLRIGLTKRPGTRHSDISTYHWA
jgi:DNA repair protein RadD